MSVSGRGWNVAASGLECDVRRAGGSSWTAARERFLIASCFGCLFGG